MRNRKTITILSSLLLLSGNAFVGTAQAGPVTINFDNLSSPGQIYNTVAQPPAALDNYAQGTLVPANARLESVDSKIPISGGTVDSVARFHSDDLSGNPVHSYVGLVNLEPTPADHPHAPTPPNGIGSVDINNLLSYVNPIRVDFNGQTTDYVAITPDLRPIPPGGVITLQAFDAARNLITSTTGPDDGSGTPISIHTPTSSISFVRFFDTGSTAAFDNLVYNAVPEPASLVLMGLGLVGVAGLALRAARRDGGRSD